MKNQEEQAQPQMNRHFLNELSLVELRRLWVRDKWDLQVVCNQIDSAISQKDNFKISISGPQGSGKSHLLQILLKHIADVYLPLETLSPQQPQALVKIVFIDQNSAQINDYIDLLNAIVNQCANHFNTLPFTQSKNQHNNPKKALENEIVAQLDSNPIIVAIDNFEHILSAIGSTGSAALQKLFSPEAEPKSTSKNPLSLIVSSSTPNQLLPFTQVNLSALNQTNTLQLIEQLLAKTTEQPTSDNLPNPIDQAQPQQSITCAKLNLCAKLLYRIFAGNGHYYQRFITAIGTPKLERLTEQLTHFIRQQTPLTTANMARLAPQQRQIISLLSLRVMQQLGAVSVNDIANNLRLTHQTTSSQLKKLRDNHWVSSTKMGRGSFYQLYDIAQSYSLAYNHLHPLQGPNNGIKLSIDFAHQWLKSAALNLPSDDEQNFIVDKTWLSKHLVTPMLPLIIRLKHHIDSYLDALNHRPTDEQSTQNQQPEINQLFAVVQQKLTTLSDNISNSPFAEQQQISALAHIELLNGLITRALTCALNQPDNENATIHAFTLSDHLFEFVSQLALTPLWKHLGELWVSTSALMAYSKDNQKLGHYIQQLEQQESKIHSQANSINIAHCLVYKSWGYAQQDNKQKLQQTLEQLRVRSDKRNSPQLTGAYCHAIKLNINYIAEQDFKLAQRLVKQMLELSHRYPIADLYFACLWRTSVFEQEQNNFEAVLKLIDKVNHSNIFNAELYQWLRHIHQPHQLNAIKDKLATLHNLGAFSAALIKTACHTLVHQPQNFIHQQKQWQQALATDVNNTNKTENGKEKKEGEHEILQYTNKILLVLSNYHQSAEQQLLLQLPPLERQLIERQLIERQLISEQVL